MSAKEPGRGPTAEAFAALLARLGPDTDRAGAAYESLRRALVALFTWRGAATPEECADETLDRLAARLNNGARVEDVPRFARGIARLVLLEHWRRPDARRTPLQEVDPDRHPAPDATEDDTLRECLNRCLSELPPEGRELILKYYVAEGRTRIERRKRMAVSLGVSETALRNRAQRLRDRLERCITGCLRASAGQQPRLAPGDTKS
jgi:DNA-directed RNA polymerase specialized sigma24 family protein